VQLGLGGRFLNIEKKAYELFVLFHCGDQLILPFLWLAQKYNNQDRPDLFLLLSRWDVACVSLHPLGGATQNNILS
jgi:hypothetical protein